MVSKCCFYPIVCCPGCGYEYCGDCMSKEPIQDKTLILKNIMRLERLGYECEVLSDMTVDVVFRFRRGGSRMYVKLMSFMDNEVVDKVIVAFNGVFKEGEWIE